MDPQFNLMFFSQFLPNRFGPFPFRIWSGFPGILWPQEKVSKRSLEVDLYVLINKVKSANNTSVYENYKRCVSGHVVILLGRVVQSWVKITQG